MATKKTTKKKPTNKPAKPSRAATKTKAKGFTSPTWERVYLMAVELDAFAEDLGLNSGKQDAEGFDVVDASRELARLATGHNLDVNHFAPKPEQEREDWISVAGIGADLGNMADEQNTGETVEGVRAIAYELCYLACDFLF